jgi:cobyrinic acid a,c-diamide synthase
MLALLDRLNDAPMAGMIPGEAALQSRLVNLGLHSWGSLRGHSFHHSRAEIRLDPIAISKPKRAEGRGEGVYRLGKLTATYLHLYFGSDAGEAAKLFS